MIATNDRLKRIEIHELGHGALKDRERLRYLVSKVIHQFGPMQVVIFPYGVKVAWVGFEASAEYPGFDEAADATNRATLDEDGFWVTSNELQKLIVRNEPPPATALS